MENTQRHLKILSKQLPSYVLGIKSGFRGPETKFYEPFIKMKHVGFQIKTAL